MSTHLTKITARGMKGRTFSYDLHPATLIVGPNFSGKTSIVEAVRLALLGHIPEVGKKPSATMELASGSELQVEATLSSGETLRRRWWLERGAVRNEHAVTDPERFAAPLLDAAAYFDMTESERVDYVFSRVQLPDQFSEAAVIARLQRMSFGEEHSEEVEIAKAKVIGICQGYIESDPLSDALTNLTTDVLKNEFATWNRRTNDTAGTVRVLTELKLRESECSAETLTDLRNEIDRLEGLIEETNREFGALDARRREAQRVERRRRELRAAMEDPQLDLTAALEEARRNLAALQAARDTITVADTPLPELSARVLQGQKLLAAAQSRLAAKVYEVAQADQKIVEVEGEQQCPFCKSDTEGWRERVLTEMLNSRDALVRQVADLRADVADIEKRLTADNEQHTALLGTSARRNQIEFNIPALTAEISRMERMIEWQVRTNNDRTKELDQLSDVEAPTPEEAEAARIRVYELTVQRNEAQAKVRTAERLQNDLRRAAESAKEHQLAKARADVIKAVAKELKAIKAEMVAAAFTELLQVANGMLPGILLSPLAYDAESGEIGRWGPQGFIGHRTFSGTEKALTYVALAAALSSQSQLRLLILDEMSRLTGLTQMSVLSAFRAAVSDGRLDQVIAVVPMDPADVEGFEDQPEVQWWSVLPLGKAVAQ